MDKRPPKPKPVLVRDSQNRVVDPTEADRIVKELTTKLLSEQRAHEKDQTMHVSRTGRRDIVVHLAITIMPTVNGVTIAGEREREYNQWCFKLPARALPVSNGALIKAFTELFQVGKQALFKLGTVRV